MVYDAAHREKIWMEAETGALIPYSCANELTENLIEGAYDGEILTFVCPGSNLEL